MFDPAGRPWSRRGWRFDGGEHLPRRCDQLPDGVGAGLIGVHFGVDDRLGDRAVDDFAGADGGRRELCDEMSMTATILACSSANLTSNVGSMLGIAVLSRRDHQVESAARFHVFVAVHTYKSWSPNRCRPAFPQLTMTPGFAKYPR